jgi:hypothetical protein
MESTFLPENSQQLDIFEIHHYSSEMFTVVDGFEKEGNPCVIILKQPKISGGSFAGIKPAVIIFKTIPEGFGSKFINLRKSEIIPESDYQMMKQNSTSKLLSVTKQPSKT